MPSLEVTGRCPKCHSPLENGKCVECNYSEESSLTTDEAREITHAG